MEKNKVSPTQTYSVGHKSWLVSDLVKQSKKYKVKYRSVDKLYATFMRAKVSYTWRLKSFLDFFEHLEKVNKAEIESPILLDNEGYICHGFHAVMKAKLLGESKIPTIKLKKMPKRLKNQW